MIVDLNSFERKTEVDRVIPAEAIELEGERLRLIADPTVKGVIEKLAKGVRFQGNISAEGEIECDRCLEPIRVPLAIALDLDFLPAEMLSPEGDFEVDEAGLKASLLEDERLDLSKIAREQLLLETPQRILCREDCKGICQKCGANLNLKPCGCVNDEIDPRWAALEGLN